MVSRFTPPPESRARRGPRRRWRTVLLIASLAFLGYQLGPLVFSPGQGDQPREGAREFPEILALIQYAYVDEVDLDTLMPGAFQGVLDAIDGRASYIPAGEPPRQLDDLLFRKTGLVLDKRNGYAHVLAVAPRSPAAEVGITAGSYIITLDGETTRTLNHYAIQKRISSDASHELVVSGAGRAEDVTLTLAKGSFEPHSLQSRVLANGVVHLALTAFYDRLENDLVAALQSLPEGGSLLLDLRNNARGDRDDFLQLAYLFLPRGTLAREVGADGSATPLVNEADPRFPGIDLALLVDASTSAAAETFAAIARETRVARVIGQTSLGLPTHYADFPLREGSHIRIPVRKLVLASGTVLTRNGVQPDHLVEGMADAPDPLLAAALDVVAGKSKQTQ